MTLFEGIYLFFTAVAIGVSIYAARESRQATRRIYAIEQAREKDREEAKLKAKLRCWLDQQQSNPNRLVLENQGPGDAWIVAVFVNDIKLKTTAPLPSAPSLTEFETYILKAGAKANFSLNQLPDQASYAFVFWLNPAGSSETFYTHL